MTNDLHTAQDIAQAREVLLLWAQNQEERQRAGLSHFPDWRPSRDRQAASITARAVHLGLEKA